MERVNLKDSDLEKIPYLKFKPTDGRILNLRIYHETENKYVGMITGNDRALHIMPNITPVSGTFWSRSLINPETDFRITLSESIERFYLFPGCTKWITALDHDFLNLASIIRKQFVFHNFERNLHDPESQDLSNIYKTELEYLLGVVRSFYEILYEILIIFYKKGVHPNSGKLPNLPKSMAKFAADENTDKLFETYKFNPPLIDFFKTALPLFKVCRATRDRIYHQGTDYHMFFMTDQGPAIALNSYPYSDFRPLIFADNEVEKNLKPNGLASFFYFTVKLIDLVLRTTNSFQFALENAFQKLESPIKDEYCLFLRDPELIYLMNIENFLESFWISEAKDPRASA